MILNLDKNKKTESDNYDAVIIGGGPAGLTAAIYLGRARIKTLVIEEMIPGGQAATTVRLENYPGFPEGIGGAELGSLMEKQAKNFGADIVYDNVINVDFNNEEKIIKLNKREIRSKIVIIASGAKPRKMKVPGAEKFEGKGISYCATCDGPLFRDKNIAIIGGGNSAIEEAIFLLRFVKSITIVQDLPKLTAEKILEERLKKHENVKLTFNNKIISINGENKIKSISVEKTDSKEKMDIPAEGIFIYIGYIPNTDYLKGHIELDKFNYVKTNENLETNIKGVFAAGDVCKKTLRQVATAVGDGAIAAFMATKYLENIGG